MPIVILNFTDSNKRINLRIIIQWLNDWFYHWTFFKILLKERNYLWHESHENIDLSVHAHKTFPCFTTFNATLACSFPQRFTKHFIQVTSTTFKILSNERQNSSTTRKSTVQTIKGYCTILQIIGMNAKVRYSTIVCIRPLTMLVCINFWSIPWICRLKSISRSFCICSLSDCAQPVPVCICMVKKG